MLVGGRRFGRGVLGGDRVELVLLGHLHGLHLLLQLDTHSLGRCELRFEPGNGLGSLCGYGLGGGKVVLGSLKLGLQIRCG